MRKLTTQEFIDRARAVHGDKYCYDSVIYQGNHIKVCIHCPDHEMFQQTPGNHLKGYGCPSCVGLKKHTNESFIEKAINIHGYTYDYSLVQYVNTMTKVCIICPEHGEFSQTPNNHLSGIGCPVCANKKRTNNSFIEKAIEVHGHKYNYSAVQYVNKQTKVKIICPEHGVFEQVPSNHLTGHSCPGCAKTGFDRTNTGFLYVLRSDCGRYMKIGITHNPKQRHNKLKRGTPFKFDCVELIEGPGDQIANLEKELLAEYQQAEFTETFDGYTEWRLWDDSIRHKLLVSKIQG